MKKTFAKIFLGINSFFLFPLATLAAVPSAITESRDELSQVGDITEMSTASSLPILVGRGINVLLGALGIVFLILVIYAGVLYLTDQGAGDKAKKAMKLLTTAVIGIVIIVAAYAISNYIIGAMVALTSSTSGTSI
jgi:hypothetical protein